jgi:hypothetical protein
MVTASSFLETPPFDKFASKTIAEVELAIVFAIQDCPQDRWGDYTDRGVMLKAAHILTMEWYDTAEVTGAAVPLAGGQPARSPVTGGDDLDLTTWGRQFKMLRTQVAGAPITFLSGF